MSTEIITSTWIWRFFEFPPSFHRVSTRYIVATCPINDGSEVWLHWVYKQIAFRYFHIFNQTSLKQTLLLFQTDFLLVKHVFLASILISYLFIYNDVDWNLNSVWSRSFSHHHRGRRPSDHLTVAWSSASGGDYIGVKFFVDVYENYVALAKTTQQ